MDQLEIAELLAQQADALLQEPMADYQVWLADSGLTLEQRQSLGGLFTLAEAVRQVLVPVRPSLFYRVQLRQMLLEGSLLLPSRWVNGRLVWLGAAAAGSALSAIGLLVFFMRRLKGPLTTAV